MDKTNPLFCDFHSNFESFFRVIEKDLAGVEALRIKVFPGPFQHLLIFFMLWIHYNFQEIFIALNPPTILRRTCPFPSNT